MQTHPESLAAAVIAWQKQHGRHQLPWQNTHDAYRIWLSEIMLQQTQVAAVIGYYKRFLERFPTVHDLAAATQEEVLGLWSGLGYYTRARNLHRCAIEVVSRFAGQFPRDPELLASLPGIGRSTAAAIAAFSYQVSSPILDGNVKRVFCRVFAIEGVPSQASVERDLWKIAERETPSQQIVAYTQGLMDLGATLCTRSRPDCQRCPLANRCQAFARGEQALFPRRKVKASIPVRSAHWLVMLDGDAVLLVKRQAGAVWEGLWAFPEVNPSVPLLAQARRTESIEHAFSHYRLQVTAHLLDCAPQARVTAAEGADWLMPQAEMRWISRDQWPGAALPAPVKKFLLSLDLPVS